MSSSSSSHSLRHNVEKIRKCVVAVDDKSKLPCISLDVSGCTTKLSRSQRHDDVIRVDDAALEVLTQSSVINWCRTMKNLYPLKIAAGTVGFLQAISLALWGFCEGSDLLNILIKIFGKDHGASLLKPRWIQQILRRNETVHNRDWEAIVASWDNAEDGTEQRGSSSMLTFPQPLHICILANILKRTIIIVESPNQLVSTWTTYNDAQRFTGIYLPLLQDPQDCVKHPLVLAIYEGILLPLVGSDVATESYDQLLSVDAFPLVSSNLESLEMQFLADSELRDAHSLLVKYLDVTEINFTTSDGVSMILAAKLIYRSLDQVSDVIILNQQANSRGSANLVNGHQQLARVTMPAGMQQNVTAPGGRTPVEHDPTAPPASIITFNEEVHPLHADEFNVTSMIQVHCIYPNCAFYTSRHTAPYCYEHVEVGNASAVRTNQSQQESFINSMMPDKCAALGCANHASENTYPYCYEHLDNKTRTLQTRRQESLRDQTGANAEFQLSLMKEKCAQRSCVNNASRNTFPMCHEHALPVREVGIQTGESIQRIASDPRVEVQYAGMMQDLESRTKRTATMCRGAGCENYGNSKCRGYCHDCYTGLLAASHMPQQ